MGRVAHGEDPRSDGRAAAVARLEASSAAATAARVRLEQLLAPTGDRPPEAPPRGDPPPVATARDRRVPSEVGDSSARGRRWRFRRSAPGR